MSQSQIRFPVYSTKSHVMHVGSEWTPGIVKTECGVAFYTKAPTVYKAFNEQTTPKEIEEVMKTAKFCQKCRFSTDHIPRPACQCEFCSEERKI